MTLTHLCTSITAIALLVSCAPSTESHEVATTSDSAFINTPLADTALSDTSISPIKAQEITYSTDTTKMVGYLAYDSTIQGKRPGILVVHEWWGHTDYVRKRAEMLARLGYVALAVDMYGGGKTAAHPADAKAFASAVMKNMGVAEARFDAAFKLLASQPNVNPTEISAVGYCFGGSVVLAMAYEGLPLDGVALFHSGVDSYSIPGPQTKARILVQNGEADPMVTQASVKEFKQKMDSLGIGYEYIAYPGVVHGYTNPEATALGEKFDLPLAYNEQADTASWNRLVKFLTNLYPNPKI